MARPFEYRALAGPARSSLPLRSLIDPDHPGFLSPQNCRRPTCGTAARPVSRHRSLRASFARTVLESQALKYRYVLEALESLTGERYEAFRLVTLRLSAAFIGFLAFSYSRAKACTTIHGPPYAPGYYDLFCELWEDYQCPLLKCKEDWCTSRQSCWSMPQCCTSWSNSCYLGHSCWNSCP